MTVLFENRRLQPADKRPRIVCDGRGFVECGARRPAGP
jgi:hypothetical protein